ncbi:MAG: hypothetical protein U9Q03_03610 [Patescibacteria group bacterium]|nr:hypothetical protein [Patescibacteria group bacterium]
MEFITYIIGIFLIGVIARFGIIISGCLERAVGAIKSLTEELVEQGKLNRDLSTEPQRYLIYNMDGTKQHLQIARRSVVNMVKRRFGHCVSEDSLECEENEEDGCLEVTVNDEKFSGAVFHVEIQSATVEAELVEVTSRNSSLSMVEMVIDSEGLPRPSRPSGSDDS